MLYVTVQEQRADKDRRDLALLLLIIPPIQSISRHLDEEQGSPLLIDRSVLVVRDCLGAEG